ncbi:hypothetical protein BDW22DRAFT_1426237 [Trametopsis cervina]|nr:hypothetical protein BDW22DRAFT_1426237 [Trametopsis cervina]
MTDHAQLTPIIKFGMAFCTVLLFGLVASFCCVGRKGRHRSTTLGTKVSARWAQATHRRRVPDEESMHGLGEHRYAFRSEETLWEPGFERDTAALTGVSMPLMTEVVHPNILAPPPAYQPARRMSV